MLCALVRLLTDELVLFFRMPRKTTSRKGAKAQRRAVPVSEVFVHIRQRHSPQGKAFFVTENEIAKQIVDAAFKIHTTLGPGLFESVYETVMAQELANRGLKVVRQQPIPVVWENVHLEAGFRADLIVEGKVIIEIKSVDNLAPVHRKQLLTYLRLADMRLGLLINFDSELIKDGIARVVNNL